MDRKSGIAWDSRLELGNEQVDRQHRQLFALVGNLLSECTDGTDVKKLKQTLDFLIDYTGRHFHDEEELQIQCGYPGYERHKKLHVQFVGTVIGLVNRFSQNGSSAELSKDVNRIVLKWLVKHIEREDRKIADYIRSVRRSG